MSDQGHLRDRPTLDGLTTDQFIDICERAAQHEAKALIDAAGLSTDETLCLRIGITAGGQAVLAELIERDLIKARP